MAMMQLTQIITLEARGKPEKPNNRHRELNSEKLRYRITIKRDAIKCRYSNEPRANREKNYRLLVKT